MADGNGGAHGAGRNLLPRQGTLAVVRQPHAHGIPGRARHHADVCDGAQRAERLPAETQRAQLLQVQWKRTSSADLKLAAECG